MSDLCTGTTFSEASRERILAWLAEGVREVSWALCSFPRARWAEPPPSRVSAWPALRHVRHLALRELYVTLPTVRHALGDESEALPSPSQLERAEAAWDAAAAIESAEAIVRGLGDTRFELLQRLEAAPDEAWERPLAVTIVPELAGAPVQLDRLMLHARQHEMEHLAAIWKIALYWDRVAPAAVSGRLEQPAERATGLPLHPADRLEESH